MFEAKVDPDIYFFGFDLTVEDVIGGTGENINDDPGWFFVIKERPGEPRFGLDSIKAANRGRTEGSSHVEKTNPSCGFIQLIILSAPGSWRLRGLFFSHRSRNLSAVCTRNRR